MKFQIHLASDAHQANVKEGKPSRPVVTLIKIRDDGASEWRKNVFEVRWSGESRTIYGHQAASFGASMWVVIDSGVMRYLDGTEWKAEII